MSQIAVQRPQGEELRSPCQRSLAGVATVLLDLDDTLIDTQPDHFRCVCKAAVKIGLEPPSWERYLEGYGKLYSVSQKAWFGDAPLDWKKFREEFERISLTPGHLTPALVDGGALVRALRAAGLRVGVVTNSGRKRTEYKLRCAGIVPEELDCLVTGDEAAAIKPAPEVLLLAQRRLGVKDGGSILYVGNAHEDEEAARAAGMRFCAVDRAEDWQLRPPHGESWMLGGISELPCLFGRPAI